MKRPTPGIYVVIEEGWRARCDRCPWIGELYNMYHHKVAVEEGKRHAKKAHGVEAK